MRHGFPGGPLELLSVSVEQGYLVMHLFRRKCRTDTCFDASINS